MALTNEVIIAQDGLKGLTTEQIAAIVTLSTNDEASVIGKRIGEVHGSYDKDIKELTGIEKAGTEKTYDYLKRAFTEKIKAAAADQVKDLNTQIEQLKKNQPEQHKAEIDRLAKERDTIKETLNQQLETLKREKVELESGFKRTRIESALDSALNGLKFKQGIPESVRNTYINATKQAIIAELNPEFDVNGQLVFAKDGQVFRNPKNGMNAFTASEILAERMKDVIDDNSRGGGGSGGAGGGAETLDLSNVTTKQQFEEAVRAHLIAKGLTKGSAAHNAEYNKLLTEHKDMVSKLKLS